MPHGVHDEVWRAARSELRELLVACARARSTVTYVDLVARVRALSLQPNDMRLFALLGELSRDEARAGRGMLSAVVVSAGEGTPGPGFFRLAERLGRDVADPVSAWVDELRRVHEAWGRAERAASPVTTVAQLRVSFASWLAGIASDPATARSIARSAKRWVHDPDARAFGPSSFVGIAGMTIATYRAARLDGRSARAAIEGVLEQRFRADAALSEALVRWGGRALAPDAVVDLPAVTFVTIGA
jgi:hypothetical protein